MTANNKAKNEFKAVAREAAQLGARFVGVTRDWFDNRRQEANRPSGSSRYVTPGRPADDDERTYGRDELAGAASSGTAGRRSGFRGIGPRGYTRTDERIREDVCEGLCDSDDINAADINVDVSGGAVRLSGTVPNRAMKHLAEDIAESCSGVRDIENSIRVAGVDPVGGSHAYGSGGARGASAGAGTSSAGYGGATGAPASGSAAAGGGGSAAGSTTGHVYGAPGTVTPGHDTSPGAAGSGTASGAGSVGGHRPDRAV
ncbi:BON domain-containing protein [Luteimonas sp. MC1828]|uniref:BON domain-containing protein n=1 Tax=Luteimonas sp. MC1828 TaxID=2799787 RepID=UPI0018F15A89|nr:BON domain-containing protein [Luteimonas sp. MC1828]MBJ7574770.1 BON domain-containing protein [Luteimonas sp. MC1828]